MRDGRLTTEEFSGRVEAALSARTLGELAALKADLPVVAGTGASALPEPVKDVVRIDQRGGSFARTGRWVVPRRLEMRPSWCHVTLDFTSAVITQPALLIDMKMRGGSLVLVVGDGMSVDADALKVRYTKIEIPGLAPDVPGGFRVTLVGRMRYGAIEVRSTTATPPS